MRATRRRTAELRRKNWWLLVLLVVLEQGFVGIATTSSSTVARSPGRTTHPFAPRCWLLVNGWIHSSSSFVASRCFLDLLLVSACPNAYNHGWGVRRLEGGSSY